jgi:exodeoxyribonuclease VII small subunit
MAKKAARSTADDAPLPPVGDSQTGRQPSFEQALEGVEQIVHGLESGQLTLDQSLQSYEEGVRLLRICHEQLSQAQRRIELLVGFDEQGQPIREDFDAGALSLEEKQQARSRRRTSAGQGGGTVDDGDGLF